MPELEQEIEGVSRRIAERLGRPYAEFEEGVRKQATVPAGGRVIGIAGTAPGLVVETNGAIAVVLPGPPPELRRLWRAALEDEAVRGVLERAEAPERRVLRVYGVGESAIARVLAEAGGEPEGVQATICAHAGEIWVELFGDGRAAGGELSRRARRGDLLRGRPAGRGARARPRPGAWAGAGGRGVVHRRARRRAS